MNRNLSNNIRSNQAIVSKPRKKKRSPIPILILALLFVVCFIFYAVQFFGNGDDNPPETTVPATSEPTTEPGTSEPTTEPETSEPTTSEPVTAAPITTPKTEPYNPDAKYDYMVILDPGHGFRDGGCSSEYINPLTEKDITLDICNRMIPLLQKAKVGVVLTHDGTSFPLNSEIDAMAKTRSFSMRTYAMELIKNYGFDKNGEAVDANKTWDTYSKNLSDSGTGAQIYNVYERAYYSNVIAAGQKIEAFVSVHVNSVDISDPNVDINKFHGFTISYCDANEFSSKSAVLQKRIVESLNSAFPSKRVIQYKDPWYDSFVVTKYCGVPAVLIETGYAVREDEGKDLATEAYRQKIAETIAAGIIKYLNSGN